MEMTLLLGTFAVAAGLGLVVNGVGRHVVAARAADDITDQVADDTDLYRADLTRPLAERVFGPARDRVVATARAVTPAWWLDRMRMNATLAGMGRWGLEGVLAMKAAFALGGVAMAALLAAASGSTPGGVTAWIAIGGVVGAFAPDIWIARRAEARQDEIRTALPETLDLLAIAVQAGMGLEQAIELVSRRLPGPLGEELHRLLREIQLGASRREALHHLRARTEVTELSSFALALAQADTLGAPIGDVLKVQAAQMRMMRRQRAREAAAKVPVKLLFPLLLGIFPALGIVVVGPAAVKIAEAFSG